VVRWDQTQQGLLGYYNEQRAEQRAKEAENERLFKKWLKNHPELGYVQILEDEELARDMEVPPFPASLYLSLLVVHLCNTMTQTMRVQNVTIANMQRVWYYQKLVQS
jgi:hypothetical protein